MYILRLKALAGQAGVRSIAAEKDFVVIRFPDRIRAPQPLIGDRRIRRKSSQIKLPRDADWRERLVSTLATLAALPQPKIAKRSTPSPLRTLRAQRKPRKTSYNL